MSLKHDGNKLIAQNSPAKGKRFENGIDATGLHKRPQMEHVASYVHFGQETVHYRDRDAKLIRNQTYTTQFDFFDAQKDQKKKWEEEKRHHEAETFSDGTGRSAA